MNAKVIGFQAKGQLKFLKYKILKNSKRDIDLSLSLSTTSQNR